MSRCGRCWCPEGPEPQISSSLPVWLRQVFGLVFCHMRHFFSSCSAVIQMRQVIWFAYKSLQYVSHLLILIINSGGKKNIFFIMCFPRWSERRTIITDEVSHWINTARKRFCQEGNTLMMHAILKVDLPWCEHFSKGCFYPNNVKIFKGASSSICKSSKGELHNNKKTLKGKAVTQRCKNLCKGQLLCDLKVLQSGNHLKQCKFSLCMGNHWVRTFLCVIFKVAVSVHLKIF